MHRQQRHALGVAVSTVLLGAVLVGLLLMSPLATAQQRPLQAVGSGWVSSPGAVVSHSLVLRNTGDSELNLDLNFRGNSWPVQAPVSVTIAAGGSVTVPVAVSVPFTATLGMLDRVDVEVAGPDGSPSAITWLVSSTGGDFTGSGYVGCRFDLDRNGRVDEEDARLVAALFNVSRPDPQFDPLLDLDHSGRIGAADIQAVSGRVGTACAGMPQADSTPLRQAVSVAGIRRHLEQFQAIADANGGNRAVAQPGYEATVAYVRQELAEAGYDVAEQEFMVGFWEELEPTVLELVAPVSKVYDPATYAVFTNSASGDITATLQPVDLVLPPAADPDTSTSGCQAKDFQGFARGNIALLQRGSCSFAAKIRNATAAGAAAVLIFNEGQPGRQGVVRSWAPRNTSIPVVGTNFAVGEELARLAAGDVQVRVHVFTRVGIVERPTRNVIAETAAGDPHHVVLLGAHLDSVPAGPGINDNGSGAALVLEIALRLAELEVQPVNKVRFGWWGAEERGLLGSEYYLEQLTEAERDDIMLNLNFDMVGSPNYVRFVYDGQRLALPGGANPASEEIEAVFTHYFDALQLPYEPVALGGRSDHAAFSVAGIPAGGLFTGASGKKTEAQATVFGGEAGKPYDACYHRPCDTVENINWEVLDQIADAAAHTTFVYAMDDRDIIRRVPGPSPVAEALDRLDYRGSIELK